MEQTYKTIKDCFLTSYKSFINCIMMTDIPNDIYNILVLRNPTYNNLCNVSIIINSGHNNDTESYHELKSNMILSYEEANNLINDIRNDFNDTHYISYSSLDHSNFIQTLKNTRFSLNIKLISYNEYEEAIKFNDRINRDGSRHKVLKKD